MQENRKISSAYTFFLKRVFPVFWFGIPLFGWGDLVGKVVTGTAERFDIFGLIAIPLFLIVIGGIVFKIMIWPLADEVHDCGDHLRIRKGAQEDRISLKDILNVSGNFSGIVTLLLDKETRFGNEISFILSVKAALPLYSHKFVNELVSRVQQAKR